MFKGAKSWLAGVAVIMLAGLFVGVPMALDNTGWLPHQRHTDMYLGAEEWSNGTFRDCVALPVRDGSILFMGCVQGAENYLAPQDMSIRYWGRVSRPDRFRAAMSELNAWKWRCQRDNDAITCWAVN